MSAGEGGCVAAYGIFAEHTGSIWSISLTLVHRGFALRTTRPEFNPALPELWSAINRKVAYRSPQHCPRNLVVPLCSDTSCLRTRQCSLGVEQIGNGSGADLVTLIRQPQAFLRVSDEGVGGGDYRKTLRQSCVSGPEPERWPPLRRATPRFHAGGPGTGIGPSPQPAGRPACRLRDRAGASRGSFPSP